MDRVHCAACNAEHDLSALEPTFSRPDAYFALTPEERAVRVRDAGDACAIRDDAGIERHYLRMRLAIPVRGERAPFHWIAWAEVDGDCWERVMRAARDESEVAFTCSAALANDFPGYPATLGLGGRLRLDERRLRPSFTLDAVQHPLAGEQRDGIHIERLLEIVGAHG